MNRLVRALATTLALALGLGLGLVALPASADPMLHSSFPATEATEDSTLTCGSHVYTFTAGSFLLVARDSTVAAHMTAVHVLATDTAGTVYRVVGTETYADPTRFVSKLRFVTKGGGIADSIDIVGHLSPNGSFHFFDFGTCEF